MFRGYNYNVFHTATYHIATSHTATYHTATSHTTTSHTAMLIQYQNTGRIYFILNVITLTFNKPHSKQDTLHVRCYK